MTEEIEERLPLELKALIVAELAARGDRASIVAFSLTQRAMVNLCQKYLFQDIELASFALVRRLLLILRESPTLAQHIRALHFFEHTGGDTKWWIYADGNVSDILAVVPNLLHLALVTAFDIPHDKFPPALAEGLHGVLPSLRTLRLINVHRVPVSLFNRMKSIRGLRISYTTFAPPEDWAQIRASTAPTQLAHLHVDETLLSGTWFERLIDPSSRFPLSVRGLHTLCIECPHDGRTDQVDRLLSNAADTLHALEINMGQCYEIEPPFVTLERMRALKVLILSDIPYVARDNWARVALSVPSLDHLVIHFDESDWSRGITEMFSRLFGPNSTLKLVTVHLDYDSYLEGDYQLKDALCKHYHSPAYDGRKVVVAEVSDVVPPVDGCCRILLYKEREYEGRMAGWDSLLSRYVSSASYARDIV
ncbi:hypothetical protein BD626DRAFT_161736 [Schizophyllum amplum]|uniref:F-box domain-containing protein n=1 Tax=Schizophyllum amplum TaxID=97359 RepID=A0A550CPB5_9AGAR|nr:hypothetical protein BD626DRAFT_161736 [Auriculariopsis ampla]